MTAEDPVGGLLDWPGDAATRREVRQMRSAIYAHDQRRRRTALLSLGSAALLRAFAPNARWRSQVLSRLHVGPRSAAFVALLCGALWSAPLVRSRSDPRPRACVCGLAASADVALDVHFLLGDRGGQPQ
mmetsp:Transcript_20449/g.81813  ORF Transcript_20449/g.81813 Transcript_20449/m.81813 type:complete len:129 (-) Transcript_20449:382-768(-)